MCFIPLFKTCEVSQAYAFLELCSFIVGHMEERRAEKDDQEMPTSKDLDKCLVLYASCWCLFRFCFNEPIFFNEIIKLNRGMERKNHLG